MLHSRYTGTYIHHTFQKRSQHFHYKIETLEELSLYGHSNVEIDFIILSPL